MAYNYTELILPWVAWKNSRKERKRIGLGLNTMFLYEYTETGRAVTKCDPSFGQKKIISNGEKVLGEVS